MNVVIHVLCKSQYHKNYLETSWVLAKPRSQVTVSGNKQSWNSAVNREGECGVMGRSELLILVWNKSRHL